MLIILKKPKKTKSCSHQIFLFESNYNDRVVRAKCIECGFLDMMYCPHPTVITITDEMLEKFILELYGL